MGGPDSEPAQASNEVEKNKMMAIFRTVDEDGNGMLERGEIIKLFRLLDPNAWTEEKADQLLAAMDTNGDGLIDIEEMVHWLNGDNTGSEMRAVQKAFDAIKAAAVRRFEEDGASEDHILVFVEFVGAEGVRVNKEERVILAEFIVEKVGKSNEGQDDASRFCRFFGTYDVKARQVDSIDEGSLPPADDKAQDGNCPAVGGSVTVEFMNGDTLSVDLLPEQTVMHLAAEVAKEKECPPSHTFKFFHEGRALNASDYPTALPGATVLCVVATPEKSYRCDVGGGEINLVCEGDQGFTDDLFGKSFVRRESWVHAPSSWPQCSNLARESVGAVVSASSNIWGSGSVAEEKLKNVLRLGSQHGDPRFVGGDNSFIFGERQSSQTLTLTLSGQCMLVRIGSMCYNDRWLNYFEVSSQAAEGGDWVNWGCTRPRRKSSEPLFFDRKEPTEVQTICFKVSSGHYYGAGARLGPVFAYGWENPNDLPNLDVIVHVGFMQGDTMPITLQPSEKVADLKKAVEARMPCPAGMTLKFLQEGRVLKPTDNIRPLAGVTLLAVISAPEKSYLIIKQSQIAIVSEDDFDFDDELAKKAQTRPESWVPSPTSWPQCSNLARESLDAVVSASSNLWGSDSVAEEKLKNVLRLGSQHGDPRFVGGDNSFIFRERQSSQTLTVTLSRPCMLVRIGSMCYNDRWLNYFEVSSQAAQGGDWVDWGCTRPRRKSSEPLFFDREEPTEVRTIRFKVSSGHYYGAGARLGPVFAYGWEAGQDPTNV